MHEVKTNSPSLLTLPTDASTQASQNKASDPAAEAGMARVRFYKTDKWEDGHDAKSVYVVPRNTIPPAFVKAFLPSTKPDPVTHTASYDSALFGIEEYPYFMDTEKGLGGAQVRSKLLRAPVADVTFDTNTFVVRLLAPPKSGVFPFTADALLKAIDAAKWQTELYCLPPSDSESKKP